MAVTSVAHLRAKTEKLKPGTGEEKKRAQTSTSLKNEDFKTVRTSSQTYQIHHHVFMERVPPLGCHLTHIHHRLRVIGVDVEDGGVDDSGDIGGVGWRARHPGVRGETDLWGREEPYEASAAAKADFWEH